MVWGRVNVRKLIATPVAKGLACGEGACPRSAAKPSQDVCVWEE
jgi:hypothetical protein